MLRWERPRHKSVSRPKSWVRDDLSPNSTCLICGGFVVDVVQLLIRSARLFVVDVWIGCATNQQLEFLL